MAKQANSKIPTHKIKVKKGDRVMVIAGADKGKSGEILQVFPGKNRVIVEDVNIRKKHQKPTNDNPGGILDKAASIHVSNVMLIDPKSGDTTRIGRREDNNGKLVRYSKKSGENIN